MEVECVYMIIDFLFHIKLKLLMLAKDFEQLIVICSMINENNEPLSWVYEEKFIHTTFIYIFA